jgi:hypothetical protein
VRRSQGVEGPLAIEAPSGLRLFVRKPVWKSPIKLVASEFGFHAFHPVDLFSSLIFIGKLPAIDKFVPVLLDVAGDSQGPNLGRHEAPHGEPGKAHTGFPSTVPVPPSILLFGSGVLILIAYRRNKFFLNKFINLAVILPNHSLIIFR